MFRNTNFFLKISEHLQDDTDLHNFFKDSIENINKLNDGMSFAYRLRACRRFGIAAAKTDYHKVRCPNDSYQHQCQSVVRTQCAERK